MNNLETIVALEQAEVAADAKDRQGDELYWQNPDAIKSVLKDAEAQAEAKRRKALPVGTGVLDYFPKALMAVAHCSKVGNDQHNAGEPLHWAREKSGDESDALIRHFLDRGTMDTDGVLHSAKVAWRALAMLEKELEGVKEGAGL
jgi:hypothetical protein